MYETENEPYDDLSDESETWTSYDDYSSYDDDDEELQSQIELIQEQMSQSSRFQVGDNQATENEIDSHEEAENESAEKENWAINSEYQNEIRNQTRSELNDDHEIMKSRSRISSQDSLHSNPKTWLDFEQENRTWRPVHFDGNGNKEVFTTNTDSLSSETRISIESSEGYKSDSEQTGTVRRKITKRNSFKKEKNSSQISSKVYSEMENQTSIIPSRLRKNSIQSLSDTGSSTHDQILPIKIKDIIQIHVEPEEKIRIQKNIERIKRLGNQTEPEFQSADTKLHMRHVKEMFFSDHEHDKYVREESSEKAYNQPMSSAYRTTASEIPTLPSERLRQRHLILRRIEPKPKPRPDARHDDRLVKRFEHSQKNAINGLENVYNRHSQRTNQLLMDLHIQMTKNGFGQYRPNADQ